LAEEDAELDSLDSHLPEFRSTPNPYGSQSIAHAAPVLPGHDGLGSFRLDTLGRGTELQEQLYAFERYNPRRVKRRRESLDAAQLELEQQEEFHLAERNQRVEAWRLEQSRILLEAIQKETRRRTRSMASSHKPRLERTASEDVAVLSSVDEAADEQLAGSDWHEQDSVELPEGQDGFWRRITQTVIRDLLGIDERLLSILFGEALPEDDDLSSTPKASGGPTHTTPFGLESPEEGDSTWQLRALERIARELGILVHRMSNHPGAFSTYVRMQQSPISYAGLPVIPEATADINDTIAKLPDESVPMPQFQPTVSHQTRPVAIPGAQQTLDSMPSMLGESVAARGPEFTQQEWEQELDITLVFRYLRSRFTSSRSPSTQLTSGTSHLATSSNQDAAAKAARVRQHHPLISNAHVHQRSRPTVERRAFKAGGSASSPGAAALRHHHLHHHHHHHAQGSCASQSTRWSARRSSGSSRHSSRHYWDLGGSIGTGGSVIASTGPMGSWSEV
jgi:hypothetical protein